MKIDPNYQIILTDKSWPLALPMVNDQFEPIGLAVYEYYVSDPTTREIYYTFNGKRFKLIRKIAESSD